jgi:hypothetical protein
METRYVGPRTEEGIKVVKEVSGQRATPLDPRLDLVNHSPSGLEWGSAASDPAQFALALLADATGQDQLALSLHQEFKRELVAGFDEEGVELTDAEILDWLKVGPPRAGHFGLRTHADPTNGAFSRD